MPDWDYAITIGENTTIPSNLNSGINFLLEDKCNFAASSSTNPTEISIYQVTGTDPQYFLLKKQRTYKIQIISQKYLNN